MFNWIRREPKESLLLARARPRTPTPGEAPPRWRLSVTPPPHTHFGFKKLSGIFGSFSRNYTGISYNRIIDGLVGGHFFCKFLEGDF